MWNRACDYHFQPTRAGDRALKTAIFFDGLTGNGGLGHTLDVLTDEEVREALAAFGHFGLGDSARLVEEARGLSEEGREALTDRYYDLTVDALEAAFQRHYREHPDEYEPVLSGDVFGQ